MNYQEMKDIFLNGLWKQNTGLVQLLGLCPLLAISNSVVNALSLGLATTLVMTLSGSGVAAIREVIPNEARIPVYVLLIAVLVTVVQFLMNAYVHPLYLVLGIFIPLIVTNCIVLARAESFASKNGIRASALDGIAMGLGLTAVLTVLGAVREIFGHGTLLTGINFVTTILKMRAPGMTYFRMPVFCWTALASSLLIVAAARPQLGTAIEESLTEGIDVQVVLDVSGSMAAEDFQPRNRLTVAKEVVKEFVARRTGDRIGVVIFAGAALTKAPLTNDLQMLRTLVDSVELNTLPDGTAIGLALAAAAARLKDSEAKTKVIVLVTDGVNNQGAIDPDSAAAVCEGLGIKVYTVGIGAGSGEPIPSYTADGTLVGHMKDADGHLIMTSLSPENQDTLKEIASITGGEYVRAEEGTVGMSQIRAELAKLQASERKARRVTVHENRFALALLPGFLLLILEAILPEAWIVRRRRRIS